MVGRLYIDGACGINLRLRRVELTIDTRIVIYGCDVPGIGDLNDTENAGNVVSLPSGCRGSLIIAAPSLKRGFLRLDFPHGPIQVCRKLSQVVAHAHGLGDHVGVLNCRERRIRHL